MTQRLVPSTIGTQSRSVKFLTIKTVVRKTMVRLGPGAWTRRCFRKGHEQQIQDSHTPPQGGGGDGSHRRRSMRALAPISTGRWGGKEHDLLLPPPHHT